MVDFNKSVTERPKCERCKSKPAIRAVPTDKPGVFKALCNDCYNLEIEEQKYKTLIPIIRNIIKEELKKHGP